MLERDGQRYCDCCGVLLTDSNNTQGYEICDECDRRLEENVRHKADKMRGKHEHG